MREQVICGICRAVCRNAHLFDNPLCAGCLAHARGERRTVDCAPEFLPLRAHILYGAVPYAATSADFHNAVSATQAGRESGDPAAKWHLEAVRARRLNTGVSLTKKGAA